MSPQENLSQFMSDLSHGLSEVGHFEIGPAASVQETERLEEAIGASLPDSFREFLLTETSGIWFDWQLCGRALIQVCGERNPISGGSLFFSLQAILEENPPFRTSDAADSYAQAYRPRPLLAFASTPNGDQFAVSLSRESTGSIVYLSHDIDDIHMYEVATSFSSFVQNYGRLGFAGPEHWVWEQFTNNRTTPIDSTSGNAAEFLEKLRTGARASEAEAEFARAEAAARRARFNVMLRPRMQLLLDARQYKPFVELGDECSDLLAGAMKARYDYFKRKKS